MAIATTPGFDATGENAAHLPTGQHAGYVTGSAGVAWTPAQWAADPGAVRIDQSPASTVFDATSDALDFEAGAVTLAELAPRAKVMLAAYSAGVRPGQRSPAVYASESNITAVVNALTAGGIASGIGLWVARFGVSEAEAIAAVADAAGPFPVIGFQYSDQGGGGTYDLDVFSVPWLETVSVAKPPAPPGQWLDPAAWTWKDAVMLGTGLDEALHMFHLSGGQWVKA
jgi:hypothetical protein